jgi:hypothetical protein
VEQEVMSFFEAGGISDPKTFFKECWDMLVASKDDQNGRSRRTGGILDDMLATGNAGGETRA